MEILGSGKCSRADADSLFGRLIFCESAVFGRANRVFLSPIYYQKFTYSGEISDSLRRALLWFKDFLNAPILRMYNPEHVQTDFVVFSDASLEGLGVVVCSRDSKRYYFSSLVPQAFSKSLPDGGKRHLHTRNLGRFAGGISSKRPLLGTFEADERLSFCRQQCGSLLSRSRRC